MWHKRQEQAQDKAQDRGEGLGGRTGPGQGLRDRIRAWDVFWDTGTGQEAGISPRMWFRALEEGPG